MCRAYPKANEECFEDRTSVKQGCIKLFRNKKTRLVIFVNQ